MRAAEVGGVRARDRRVCTARPLFPPAAPQPGRHSPGGSGGGGGGSRAGRAAASVLPGPEAGGVLGPEVLRCRGSRVRDSPPQGLGSGVRSREAGSVLRVWGRGRHGRGVWLFPIGRGGADGDPPPLC